MQITTKTLSMSEAKSEFILQKVEELLARTLADREILTSKANWMIGVVGALLTFLVSLLIEGKVQIQSFWGAFVATQSVLLLVLGLFLAKKCVLPSKYRPPGGAPKDLTEPEFFNQKIETMIMGYSLLLEKKVEFNIEQNKKMAKAVTLTPFLAFCSVPVSLLIGFALRFLWLF